MERLTEQAPGCFEYRLKGHKSEPGEFGNYDAFFDYSMAVKRLGQYEDTGLEPEEIKLFQARALLGALESPQMAEYSGSALERADKLVEQYEAIGPIDHLRDLIQAEQEGQDAQELYRLALDTWGADAQTLMVFEEMSELQKELCKHARGKDNQEAIADEIADVLIMLEQMMIMHDCEQEVYEHKAAKLKRLASRLSHEGAALEGEGGDNHA